MPENLDRCRACRARLAEDGICPRCGCDFSLARQAMEQAGQRLAHALRALAAGEADVARSAVDASLGRIRNPTAPTRVYEPSSSSVNVEFGPGSP
jgi:hypothetical protein